MNGSWEDSPAGNRKRLRPQTIYLGEAQHCPPCVHHHCVRALLGDLDAENAAVEGPGCTQIADWNECHQGPITEHGLIVASNTQNGGT